MLAQHRSSIEQAVIRRVVGALTRVGDAGRCRLELQNIHHAFWDRVGEDVRESAETETRHLARGVVQADGRLAGDQITQQVALGERQVVRISQRELWSRKRAGDVDLDPHIAAIGALSRLTNRVNRADVESGIQVRSSVKRQRSALHVERWLDERLDEIQSVRSLVGAERSLERQPWRLSRIRRSECHVERSTELDVRFR